MKRFIPLMYCLIFLTNITAQTDELNMKKYWKFRDNFRENYVKIGASQGESLPAGRRNPGACIDNVDYAGDKGWIYWGDGMIRQGHYIGFLATEYRLLKDHGGDYWPVLNELYYALRAINRVDRDAEPTITSLNEYLTYKPQSLNGFYLRDDVPENFYQKWEDTKIKCRCTDGAIYQNNNVAKVNSEVDGYFALDRTNAWSVPSLDQMTSLLVGLAVCDKLLDDGLYVQPTPADPVMDLRNEVKQISNRIITYARDHNWYLLDEWGWPVDNGGGDLTLTAYPIALIGENIVGTNYQSTMKRKAVSYNGPGDWYRAHHKSWFH